ncbi:YheT family hydrolase [Rosistilla ulvae]|uniref:YheT family hydrolase n=1 Tax=Rosistilla ulvae TaxID=1930277 RepID=UPI001C54CB52|nr:alpha/beta fold hydrolase [Rosistilla ulvae]
MPLLQTKELAAVSLSFQPHPLLLGGHLQTLATTLIPTPQIPYKATQHRVVLDDEDQIVLHDDTPPGWTAGQPVAILLHGLCGCHGASYMIRMADKMNRCGVRVFRMDMRGCGAGRDLARELPHSGRSGDLLAAITRIAELCDDSPIWPIGISMGGNILLKMLGEIGKGILVPEFPADRIARAAAVAPPIDPARCCRNMSRWMMRPYGLYFIRKLRSRVAPLVEQRDDWRAINWNPHPRTLWDFDGLVTAPLSGFRDVEDYYAQAAAAPLASGIAVPTMILASEDDPIIPIGCLRDADWPGHVELHTTRRGGHVGFIGGRQLETGDRYWMDAKLLNWFDCPQQ